MPKIFISYGRDASHGQNLATEAQQQLQAAGFEVFRDVIGLIAGDKWEAKLESELEISDLVVLIVSEKSKKSEWVNNEISLAKELELPIIPVLAEKTRMLFGLRHLHALDFTLKADWQMLFRAISTHLGAPVEDEIPTIREVISNTFVPGDEIPTIREVANPSGILCPPVNINRNLTSKVDDDYLRPVALPKKKVVSLHDPYWASNTGKDQYGQYADLEINNVTQRFRLINSGTFQMGSPEFEEERYDDEIQHRVTISKPFWLADTACTQALWVEVMRINPSYFSKNKNNPVEQVSWDDIQEFIQVLGQIKSGVTFQLPTEAQWEYACRAGTVTPFSFGENMTSEQVNYNGNSPYKKGFFQKKDLYRAETVTVQKLPPNQWGLFEMHGNIWEWCQDWYGGYLKESSKDPLGTNSESGSRVFRGGSWGLSGWLCRSATRYANLPDTRSNNVGFRLALVN